MSAGGSLSAALLDWLRGEPALGAVFDAPPVRGALPYLVIEEPVLAAADLSGLTGRVGTIAVQFHDAGERPVRLRALIGVAEARIEVMPADLGAEGWRVAALSLVRSRLARAKDGWLGRSEWAVRVYRANS